MTASAGRAARPPRPGSSAPMNWPTYAALISRPALPKPTWNVEITTVSTVAMTNESNASKKVPTPKQPRDPQVDPAERPAVPAGPPCCPSPYCPQPYCPQP